MYNYGSELRRVKYQLEGAFLPDNPISITDTKVHCGQVIGYETTSSHYALKVRQYPPIGVNNGTLQFDDGSRSQLSGATDYVKVSVVNCQDSTRIKTLFLPGQKIWYWNEYFNTSVTADNYPSNWVTLAPTEDFYASVDIDPYSSSGYTFTAGYYDGAATNKFTTISFTGDAIPWGSIYATASTGGVVGKTICHVHPIWDTNTSAWVYYFTVPGVTYSVIVKITSAASGGGKYNGRVFVPPTSDVNATGNVVEGDMGTLPGADDALIINMNEKGQSTHDLTNASNTLQLYFHGKWQRTNTSGGKKVVYINGFWWENCT